MSIHEIELPKYSLGEEISNSITHGIGSIFFIIATILMGIKAAPTNDPLIISAAIIYGVCMVIMFTMSSVYHGLARNNGKRVLRVLDHNAVFIAIAGSYTAYTLIAMTPVDIWGWGTGVVGYIMFSVVWICTILGITFNSIHIKKYAKLSMFLYIMIGWIIIFAFVPLYEILGFTCVMLIVGGGISYTVGAVVYAFGKKARYIHTIFHVFVLIGALLMFVSIYLFVL